MHHRWFPVRWVSLINTLFNSFLLSEYLGMFSAVDVEE